jgi:hypothetical protein
MSFKKLFLLGTTFCLNISSSNAIDFSQFIPMAEHAIKETARLCACVSCGTLILRVGKHCEEKCQEISDEPITVKLRDALSAGAWAAAVTLVASKFLMQKVEPEKIISSSYSTLSKGIAGGVGVCAASFVIWNAWENGYPNNKIFNLLGFCLLDDVLSNGQHHSTLLAVPLALFCYRHLYLDSFINVFTVAYYIFENYYKDISGFSGVAASALGAFVTACCAGIAQKYLLPKDYDE